MGRNVGGRASARLAAAGSEGHRPAYPRRVQCFRGTIPQSASPAPGWRVSGANLEGRQNLFCAPEPQPGGAEDGAKTHKEALGTAVGGNAQGSLGNRRGRKRTREPWETAVGENHTREPFGKRRGRKNAKEPRACSLTPQKTHYPMPPLCKGRCPVGAEGLSFSYAGDALCNTAKGCDIPYNPSVSFASSRLEGERSEPGGAAKFILRPGTPARRSRGWGETTQGTL